MSEPIRDLETAVRELGALPMPAGPEPKESGPRSFALAGEVQADDYDDAVYAAEQAYSGMRGQGYKGSISVDTGSGQSAAGADALELPGTALEHVQAILLAHFGELPRPDMAVGLLLTNLRTEWEAEGRARIADLEAARKQTTAHVEHLAKTLVARTEDLMGAEARVTELEAAQGTALRRTVTWRLEVQENDCWWDCGQSADSYPAAQDLLARERAEKPGIGFRLVCRTTTDTLPGEASSYPPALPWAKHMDREDLAEFLLELGQAAVGHDDVVQALAEVEKACGTWRLIAEAQHAHNTAPGPDDKTKTTADPQALRAEDTADLLTLALAQRAEADYDAASQTISLELTATREQWSTWQKALKVDLARTTNRGSCTTSHATWRGIHVVIRCYLVQDGCPRNVIDGDVGAHLYRKGAFADSPVACSYCGTRMPEGSGE